MLMAFDTMCSTIDAKIDRHTEHTRPSIMPENR